MEAMIASLVCRGLRGEVPRFSYATPRFTDDQERRLLVDQETTLLLDKCLVCYGIGFDPGCRFAIPLD
jgi:hypothetical protein